MIQYIYCYNFPVFLLCLCLCIQVQLGSVPEDHSDDYELGPPPHQPDDGISLVWLHRLNILGKHCP